MADISYRYKAFGLSLASDIQLPELLAAAARSFTPDVRVVLDRVPANLEDAAERCGVYEAARNEFLFRVKGVAGYYITGGNRIAVEPEEQAEDRYVRIFLLGTAFGVLLLQRSIIPIHGSAVVLGGSCAIFTGESGVGKSTLSAAFRKRGYAILTDDVAAVLIGPDGVVRVQSAYPQQKLWPDSAAATGFQVSDLAEPEGKLALPADEGFCHSPVPLAAVYELTTGEEPEVRLAPLPGADGLTVLMNNTYRCWLIEGMGLRREHFQKCLAIGARVAVSRLIRPEGKFSLEQQMGLVESDVQRLVGGGGVLGPDGHGR